MGARTPDAYRIGAGQVAQEYQADAAPVRLSKQPSLPTMSRAPQAPPVEQVVTAEVAVVRRTAGVSSRQSKEARLSKEPAAVAQCNIVVRDAAPVQAAPAARRVLSGRPGARVSAPRAWTAASVPPVVDSIIAGSSCSSSASYRRSSLSQPSLVVGFCAVHSCFRLRERR